MVQHYTKMILVVVGTSLQSLLSRQFDDWNKIHHDFVHNPVSSLSQEGALKHIQT